MSRHRSLVSVIGALSASIGAAWLIWTDFVDPSRSIVCLIALLIQFAIAAAILARCSRLQSVSSARRLGAAHLFWASSMAVLMAAFTNSSSVSLGVTAALLLAVSVICGLASLDDVDQSLRSLQHWLTRIDLALVLGSVLLVQWLVLAEPILSSGHDTIAKIRLLSAPTSSAALFAGLGFVVLTAKTKLTKHKMLHIISLGLLGTSSAIGTWAYVHSMSALSASTLSINGFAAWVAWQSITESQREQNTQRAELPPSAFVAGTTTAMVSVALFVAIGYQFIDAGLSTPSFIGFVSLLGLAVIRLWLSTISNRELSNSLTATVRSMQRRTESDPLTGLPIRQLAEETGDRLARERAATTAVVVINITAFRRINTTYGYRYGNEVLRTLADRFATIVSDAGVACRVGGDEFFVINTGLEETRTATFADEVLRAVREPIHSPYGDITCNCSMGIASSNSSGIGVLIKQASEALYSQRLSTTPMRVSYAPHMSSTQRTELQLRSDLCGAVLHNEFEHFYQPVVSLETRRVIGAEALLRWNHPTRGVLTPQEFLVAANESNLITEFSGRLIRESLRRFSILNTHLAEPLSLTHNLSAVELNQPSLADDVSSYLIDCNFDPRRLIFDITSEDIDDIGFEQLNKLTAIGVRFALDRLSDIARDVELMTRICIDEVKIARRLVKHLNESEQANGVAKAIVVLAQGFGARVSATGVETAEQAIVATRLGCDRAQGQLFGKPTSYVTLSATIQAAETSEAAGAAEDPERFENSTAPISTTTAAPATT